MDTDSALLQAARQMDQDALVKIFDLYAPALFRFVVRRCGDPVVADHVVGDVFTKLLEQLSVGKGPSSNLRSYLFEIAYHRLVDEVRYGERRTVLNALISKRQDTSLIAPAIEDQILVNEILRALDELTAIQRQVIILRFLEERSIRETAAIVGKAVSNVKVIQSRAVTALRKSLLRKGQRNGDRKGLPESLGA